MAKNSIERTLKFLRGRTKSKRNRKYERQLDTAILYKVPQRIWKQALNLEVLAQVERFELPHENFVLEFFPAMNFMKGLVVEFIHFMTYNEKTKFEFPKDEDHDDKSTKLMCDDVLIRICFRRGSFFPAITKMAIKNEDLYVHQKIQTAPPLKTSWTRLMVDGLESDADSLAPFVIFGLQSLFLSLQE